MSANGTLGNETSCVSTCTAIPYSVCIPEAYRLSALLAGCADTGRGMDPEERTPESINGENKEDDAWRMPPTAVWSKTLAAEEAVEAGSPISPMRMTLDDR